MGQNLSPGSNPALEDWHPLSPSRNIFCNRRTGEQVECHLVHLRAREEAIIRKRMQEHHNFIVRVMYYEFADRIRTNREVNPYYVYTERLHPLSQQLWVPLTSALSILKGFRRLSSTYGMVRVTPGMVRVNQRKEIRVWVNENPGLCQPLERVHKQQIMLADIVQIIMNVDSNIATLMMKCTTLNQSINNILHSMTENKSAHNYSSRTNKKQEKSELKHRNNEKQQHQSAKYNFRSTKQTQDDSVRPFRDHATRHPAKKQAFQNQPQKSINYLHNVNILKPPAYINTGTPLDASTKNLFVGFKKQEEGGRTLNYSQTANVQKSAIQLNNSHQGKNVGTARPFRPVEYRKLNSPPDLTSQSVYKYSEVKGQLSPTYERAHKQSSSRVKEYQQRHNTLVYPQHPAGRQSNLNRNYLHAMDGSQDSGMGNDSKLTHNSAYANQSSEANTSRDLLNSDKEATSLNKNLMSVKNLYTDAGRTRTQEFHISQQMIASSPRLQQNYVQNYVQVTPKHKPAIAQSEINIGMKRRPETPIKDADPVVENSAKKYSHYTSSQPQPEKPPSCHSEQDKKNQKLQQARTIREEMNILGIETVVKPLVSDTSARDLLIKQKVEEKNKKHEELKFAITRLLSQ